MDEKIRESLTEILSGVSGQVANIATEITKSPEQFNSTIWAAITSISNNAVLPIAYMVLGFLFLMDFYNITIKMNSQNQFLPMEPIMAMVKVAVTKYVVENTMKIMLAVFGLASEIVTKAAATLPGGGELNAGQVNQLMETLKDASLLEKILMRIELLPMGLIIQLLGTVAWLISISRMIEIYMYCAVAPIPLATFASPELSSMGKNFLKSFAGVSLQGLFIIIVVAIYQVLIQSAATSTDIPAALGTVLGYSLLLVMALLQTGKWAKSIMNAA